MVHIKCNKTQCKCKECKYNSLNGGECTHCSKCNKGDRVLEDCSVAK